MKKSNVGWRFQVVVISAGILVVIMEKVDVSHVLLIKDVMIQGISKLLIIFLNINYC